MHLGFSPRDSRVQLNIYIFYVQDLTCQGVYDAHLVLLQLSYPHPYQVWFLQDSQRPDCLQIPPQ